MYTQSILHLRLLLSFFLVPFAFCNAQEGNPRHPGVARFELIGTNIASDIVPLSDLNADGIADFALMQGDQPWVYHGVPGRLPESTSGVRLGPTEMNAITSIRAVGDWDGMNGPDICVYWSLSGDTSFGNTEGIYPGTAWITVFWNQGDGTFTLADTSRLFPGLYGGFVSGYGAAADFNKDGVTDLYLTSVKDALHNGELVPIPRGHIFTGHKGERWGRGGIANTPDWQWWFDLPFYFSPKKLDVEDLDLDGAPDLAFITDDEHLIVLYGNPRGLPDTNEVEILNHGGRAALFSDVTGDGVAEMNIINQDDDLVRVYIGCTGQRLLEQFGTGNEPPRGERWWGKPWASVKGPNHVSSAWFGFGIQLFDLGSADSNATEEIWVQSSGFLLCYDVGGQVIEGVRYGLDSLFDGQVQGRMAGAKRVGDINGDGRAEFALLVSGSVYFYRTVAQLPTPTPTWWRVPKGCDVPSAVEEDKEAQRLFTMQPDLTTVQTVNLDGGAR